MSLDHAAELPFLRLLLVTCCNKHTPARPAFNSGLNRCRRRKNWTQCDVQPAWRPRCVCKRIARRGMRLYDMSEQVEGLYKPEGKLNNEPAILVPSRSKQPSGRRACSVIQTCVRPSRGRVQSKPSENLLRPMPFSPKVWHCIAKSSALATPTGIVSSAALKAQHRLKDLDRPNTHP